MKRNLLLTSVLILAMSANLFGCGNPKPNQNDSTMAQNGISASESVFTETPVTEPATEHVDSTKSTLKEYAQITTGTLTELSEETDNYGNQQATFAGEDGIDFIAIVNPSTDLPNDFAVGKEYNVYHSDIMTMSIPGQYPEVYEISKPTDESAAETVAE